MNYRHAFHAGNFADVVKHVALVAIIEHLKKKDTPFAAIDTHAGRGLYDLASAEAVRTNEWENGIGRLAGIEDGPAALLAYLKLVRGLGAGVYPGSPLIAARLKRRQDRLIAIEREPDEAEVLRRTLVPFANARAMVGDGYATLRALLPPPERRGIVLIDPPYERAGESGAAAKALIDAHRRFATGIYLLWFPLKSASEADSLCGEISAGGVTRGLRIDFSTGASSENRLTAAGLVVVNPPYGFSEEISQCLGVLEGLLADATSGRARSRIIGLDEAVHES